MLKSNAKHAVARWALYALMVFCLSLFGWILFHVMRIALFVAAGPVRVVLGTSALAMAGLLGSATTLVLRSRHTGGHLLISLAAILGAFVGFIGLGMVVS